MTTTSLNLSIAILSAFALLHPVQKGGESERIAVTAREEDTIDMYRMMRGYTPTASSFGVWNVPEVGRAMDDLAAEIHSFTPSHRTMDTEDYINFWKYEILSYFY